ncbi:MAG: hypothetical protein JKY80_07525 [Mariprofundaceae bacterium]|nr:hypothetical protein [Mariprofundaceae bacterium]
MPKPSTKSFGIRISRELSNWIDLVAKNKRITRNQCVTGLIFYAKKKVAATKPKAKQAWAVKAAWTGYFCASVVVTLSLEGFVLQIMNA